MIVTEWEIAFNGSWSISSTTCKRTCCSTRDTINAIYIIVDDGRIIYVGEAGRGLKRISDGFTLAINQSAAYKWRTQYQTTNRILTCLLFKSLSNTDYFSHKINREALEADIATLISKRYGEWPESLTRLNVHGAITRDQLHATAFNDVVASLESEGYVSKST